MILDSSPPPGGYRGPTPPPIPIGRDAPQSDPPRHWYQRLEIVLPALIALGLVTRVLLDVYEDVLNLKRRLPPRTTLLARQLYFLVQYTVLVHFTYHFFHCLVL